MAAAWWATSGLFVKFIASQADVSSIALAFWRDLLTFLTLLVGVALLRPAALRIRRDDLPRLAAMGAMLGAFHVFWNLAVLLNGAAVATIQQAAAPAIVVVIARLVWRESLAWRKLLAIVLAFAGTVLVSGIGEQDAAPFTMVGLAVGFCLPLGYAGWTVFGKSVRGPYSPLVTLTYGFGFGALTLLPLQLFVVQPWSAPVSFWLGFAGWIAQTIIAFGAYIYGLGKLPAGVASILAMSEIAFVGLYAYFLLGERLAWTQIFGVALVGAGVLLLTPRPERGQKGEVISG
ncbi:MAG: EamA family transporter [Chloroflexi bacterium]|nr:EamA family transporter [Chloroflexota bacterium]